METPEWDQLKEKSVGEVKADLETMPAIDLVNVGRRAIHEQLEEAPNKAQLEVTLETILGRFEAAARGVQPGTFAGQSSRETALSR